MKKLIDWKNMIKVIKICQFDKVETILFSQKFQGFILSFKLKKNKFEILGEVVEIY